MNWNSRTGELGGSHLSHIFSSHNSDNGISLLSAGTSYMHTMCAVLWQHKATESLYCTFILLSMIELSIFELHLVRGTGYF